MTPIWAKKAGKLPYDITLPTDYAMKAGKPNTMDDKGTVTDIPVGNTHYEMNVVQKVRSTLKNK